MLIAAAAVYGGVSYTALKREQLNELEALCHMLRLMQDELETRALPLPELAAQLDTRTENAGKALLSGLLRRLPGTGGLCPGEALALPLRGGEAHMQAVPGTLLPEGHGRAHEGGHAVGRAQDDSLPPPDGTEAHAPGADMQGAGLSWKEDRNTAAGTNVTGRRRKGNLQRESCRAASMRGRTQNG